MKSVTALMLAAVLFGNAQADDPKAADAKPSAKGTKLDDKLKKPDESKPAKPEGEDEAAKILDRLTKNTSTAEERLAKSDAGDETRKLQRDALRDIDELLKQFQKPPQQSESSQSSDSSSGGSSSSSGGNSQSQGGAQSKGGSSPSSGSDSSGGSTSKPSGGQSRQQRQQQREQRRQQQASSGSKGPQPKGGDKPGNDSATAQNGGQPPMPKGQSGDGPKPEPKKDAPGGKGADGRPTDKARADDAKLAEMYKDVWGHLPEKMRQEMDTYFKERFMPRYNDLLKQYYSSIAEQNKK